VRLAAFALALALAGGLAAPAGSAAPRRAVAVDWTRTVVAMPSGGFRMGNPKAPVALIEYGSMICPHCRRFDEAGVTPLISKYVKTGKVSYEFRNYLLNALDIPASLIARCNGAKSFFPLTRALFKDQVSWIRKVQAVPKAQFDSLDSMPPEKAVATVAGFAGLPQWAAARGVPRAKSAQCLANTAEIDRLVKMTSDATTEFPGFSGTPTFVINGKMVDLGRIAENEVWPTLEKKLNEAL
jgi:protein-disulfide isomerase